MNAAQHGKTASSAWGLEAGACRQTGHAAKGGTANPGGGGEGVYAASAVTLPPTPACNGRCRHNARLHCKRERVQMGTSSSQRMQPSRLDLVRKGAFLEKQSEGTT